MPVGRYLCRAPTRSHTIRFRAPPASNSRAVPIPAAPAPAMTMRAVSRVLPTSGSALYSPASTSTPAPWAWLWKMGTFTARCR
jgi:hypothetical protein